MKLLDTGGTEQFTAIRDLYMKNGDGFILIYSVSYRGTFEDLVEEKEQILRVKDSDDVPLVLVGTHSKSDERPRVVTAEQGKEMAKKLGGPFFEIDPRNRDEVDAVVKALLPLIFTWREEKKKQKKEKDRDCVVM